MTKHRTRKEGRLSRTAKKIAGALKLLEVIEAIKVFYGVIIELIRILLRRG